MPRFASTVSALAMFAALPAPAFAQFDGARIIERMNEAGREIEQGLERAEAARIAGKCELRNAILLRVSKIIEELEGIQSSGGLLGGTRERTNEARSRAQAILNAPCPPMKNAPPPPAAQLTSPPVQPAAATPTPTREPGQTRTLEDLQIEYAASSCGTDAEKDEAKRNLLTALDRAIGIERSPQKRDRMLTQRQRIADGTIGRQKPCPKPSETSPPPTQPTQVGALPATGAGNAPPAAGVDDFGKAVAGRMGIATEIEQSFAVAERARLAGDCVLWTNRLSGIEMLVGAFETGDRQADDAAKAAYADWRRRLAEARSRPCPPTEWDEPPKVGALPQSGSPLAAVDAVAKDRFARRAAVLLNAYYLSAFLPRVGIGVRRDGAPGAAPERFAAETPRKVNGFGISAGFQTKISPEYDLRTTATYESGEAKGDYTVPATNGTQRVDTGAVYGRLSNGSSGIIAGFGASGSTKVNVTNYLFDASIYRGFTKAAEEYSGIRIGTGVTYERSDRRYDTSISSSGTSGGSTFSFGQTRTQTVNEDFLDFTGRLEFDIPITTTTDGGLTFTGNFKAGPYYRDTGLRSSERNTANFGSVGNRDVTLDITDKKSGWGGRVSAFAGLEYEFRSGFTVRAGGGVDYRSDVGTVINPNSGDQVFFQGQTTRLGSEDRLSWSAGAGIRIPF